MGYGNESSSPSDNKVTQQKQLHEQVVLPGTLR